MDTKKYSRVIAGKEFFVELTRWAEQAHGSVTVRLGDTVILATAVMSPYGREGGDFFPLTVEYEEKFYAAGKILGSRFVKRETRPSEEAILAARLIDRSIRPRFDMRMRNEVQIVITVLALDDQNDPDVLALFAASLALSLSNIPWSGPVAAVRVARVNNEFIANPTYQDREHTMLDVIVSGTRERINMIEAGAHEILEDDFLQAITWGQEYLRALNEFQDMIVGAHIPQKISARLLETPQELKDLLTREFAQKIEDALYQKVKKDMKSSYASVKEEWLARAREEFPETFQKSSAEYIFEEKINEIVHRNIIEHDSRPDGRTSHELRALSAEVAVLPRIHGSGLFMRGETHVLSTLTLGAPGDEQIVEGMEIRTKKRFLHHYNFPPFSTGEVKPMRGPGRREIGHGALAGKAILPLLPTREEFPYTIRIVSEVLSSNGSSSMASVCGSSLALMDAGVPIKKPMAGAAMGLMLNEQGAYKVLTDIQGPEDHHGDMDFKVAGTRDGITAVQMDVKIEGITLSMIQDTLTQARAARLTILDVMDKTLASSRSELSPWAPRVNILKINPEKIGALIGPGGKVINDIIAQTGAQIDIDDDGTVFITSDTADGMTKALTLVKQVTKEIKPGELLEGRITRLLDFGVMVEIGPRQEGLIHISELAPWHVERVTDILKPGEIVPVKVKNIDEQGRVNLSLKDVPGRYSDEEIQRGQEEREQMGNMPRGGMPRGRYRR